MSCDRKGWHNILVNCFIRKNMEVKDLKPKVQTHILGMMEKAYKKNGVEFPEDFDVSAVTCHDALAAFRSICKCKEGKKSVIPKCADGDYGSNRLAARWQKTAACPQESLVLLPHCSRKKNALQKALSKISFDVDQTPFKMCKSGGRLISC